MLTAPTASAATTTRLAGPDRYTTAVAVSEAAFPNGHVPIAYVATGAKFPDALAGGAAAARAGGPMLLVEPTAIPSKVATELTRLKPARIVIEGGAGSVSDSVAIALQQFTAGTVTRNGGADRYEVAVATSRSAWPNGATAVAIASGGNYPDALSAGSLFSPYQGPILLSDPSTGLSAGAKAELSRLKPSTVFLLGGTGSVPSSVASQVQALGFTTRRLAGPDRYAASLAIAQAAYPTAGSASNVYVATGENFPDGLTAGPLAAVQPGPVLLVRGGDGCWDQAAFDYLQTLKPAKVTFVGGTGSVNASFADLTVCPPDPVIGPGGVSSADTQQVIVAGSATGTIEWYQFDGTSWGQEGTSTATFGYNGVKDGTLRREGDGTTPTGTYPILLEFGISNINSKMPFNLITDCSYWIENGTASDYNRWREQCGAAPTNAVHLMDYVTNARAQYRHAALIGFNYDNPIRPPAPGSGSGVMLHYEPVGISTTGCVGVGDRVKVEEIMAWMDSAQNPTIVIS